MARTVASIAMCSLVAGMSLLMLDAAGQSRPLQHAHPHVSESESKKNIAIDSMVFDSGVFLNAGGDVLTARHAVARCKSIYVVKDGHVVEATVRTISHDLDLAVLGTSLKPYLSATLPLTTTNTGSTVGVFAEAYSVLQRLPDRANLLSNAMTIPSDDGLQMLSGVKPGASGSGVLSGTGLLLGVVVERVGSTSGTGSVTSTTMLSRATAAGAPAGATLVRAIGITQVKEFLREGGIVFTESDAAQLGPQQSPAARAATLSVGIICG